jgi:hypothetical protein
VEVMSGTVDVCWLMLVYAESIKESFGGFRVEVNVSGGIFLRLRRIEQDLCSKLSHHTSRSSALIQMILRNST